MICISVIHDTAWQHLIANIRRRQFMVDFMILYEVPTREFESISLLSSELRCRGYKVVCKSTLKGAKSNYSRHYREMRKYRNNVKILLVPSLYHDKELLDYFYFPFGKVEKIVNLRWEQYYVNEIMEKPGDHLYLYPNESGKNAYQLSWGAVSHQNMIAAGIAEDRLIDAGPLHMDLLRDEFRGYYISKQELLRQYQLEDGKQTVLFISSFANATDRSEYFDFLNEFFSGNYSVDVSRIQLEQASYGMALKWFDDFMQTHKSVNFVYRPHPSETVTEQLQSLEQKYENFRIIRDFSVKQWILSCETIVTWMSTSIIEAYFAGKPCFIIRPVEYPFEKDMYVYRGARFITSEEEFLRITDITCENSLSDDLVHQCYDVQQVPSYVRLSDELEKILNGTDRFPWDKQLLEQYDKELPQSMLKYSIAATKRNAKDSIARVLSAIQKKTNLSYGKKIDEKLRSRTYPRHNKKADTAFAAAADKLDRIVKRQRKSAKI